MSIGSVGSSFSNIQARFQSFQSGKTNITKDDLKNIQSEFTAHGKKAPKEFDELSKNFDKIDTNGDGISSKELSSYAKSQGASIPSSGFPGSGTPPAMTKDDLIAMQSKMAQLGGQAPKGLDKLIGNFDKYAGSDGKLSADEFKSFADENGIQMPSGGPPSAGGASGAGGASDLTSKFLDQLLGSSDDDKKKKESKNTQSDKESLSSSLKKLVTERYSANSKSFGSNSNLLTSLLSKEIAA